MRSLNEWLDLYAVSHQNPINKIVHKICVPAITFTVFGMLWSIPFPEVFTSIPYLNWASIFGLLALIFYARLGLQTFLVMLFQVVIFLWLCGVVASVTNLLTTSIIIFILAWIGQFWGHKIEGKKPSFFEDIQFLLIGPIWVAKAVTGFPKKK